MPRPGEQITIPVTAISKRWRKQWLKASEKRVPMNLTELAFKAGTLQKFPQPWPRAGSKEHRPPPDEWCSPSANRVIGALAGALALQLQQAASATSSVGNFWRAGHSQSASFMAASAPGSRSQACQIPNIAPTPNTNVPPTSPMISNNMNKPVIQDGRSRRPSRWGRCS